jgi:iron complex outermembrane receptor protein/vitamin B12 transporter
MHVSSEFSRPQGRFSATSLFDNFNFTVRNLLAALVFVCAAASAHAAVVRGTVTDRLGAAVRGAHVNLVQDGKVVTSAVSGYDGSYELTSTQSGRFVVTAIGTGFGLAVSPQFYSSTLHVVTEDIILKPASVNDEVTVTATGLPTPQAQLSSSTDVIHGDDLTTHVGILDALRLMPGVNIVQTGQTGGVTSLFIRGGQSAGNKVVIDGMPANDVGGVFDLGTVSSTGLERVEVYRGPDSVIYGADAASGVLSFETPRGVTPSPVFLYSGDAGDYHSYRNEIQGSGTYSKLDYLAGFSRFDTSNAIADDRYHDATSVANAGYSLGGTQARFTLRNSVSASGVPGAYDFSHMVQNAKQGDQDLYLTGTLENRTPGDWHNLVRYGVARKREQVTIFAQEGTPVTATQFGFQDLYYIGNAVTIRGANGYSATGAAILGEEGTSFPDRTDQVNNRDEFQYLTDYRFGQHFAFFGGFHYDHERGAFYEFQPFFSIVDNVDRTNYDYTAEFQGDIKNRVFLSIGTGVEKDHLFGMRETPRFGLAWYPRRPGGGKFDGTKVRFNFSKAVQDADIFSQLDSLKSIVAQFDPNPADANKVPPVGPQTTRTYEGGVDQSLLGQKLLVKATFFHNEYTGQVEFVGVNALSGAPFNIPSNEVLALQNSFIGGAYVNTLAYRALGSELEVEYKPLSNLFIRGGYTYLDAVTQQSYASSTLAPTFNPTIPGVAIGATSPLKGARPFRRAPHTGYFSITYAEKKWVVGLTSAMVSRSDDSTFLGSSAYRGATNNADNSLLLPNRNLDFGYLKLDANATYQFNTKLTFFGQVDNLMNNQHIGPIGYPSLPANFRLGVKVRFGL